MVLASITRALVLVMLDLSAPKYFTAQRLLFLFYQTHIYDTWTNCRFSRWTKSSVKNVQNRHGYFDSWSAKTLIAYYFRIVRTHFLTERGFNSPFELFGSLRCFVVSVLPLMRDVKIGKMLLAWRLVATKEPSASTYARLRGKSINQNWPSPVSFSITKSNFTRLSRNKTSVP